MADLGAHAALFAPQLSPTLARFLDAQGRLQVLMFRCPETTNRRTDNCYRINNNLPEAIAPHATI
jgi:hypothetical protein